MKRARIDIAATKKPERLSAPAPDHANEFSVLVGHAMCENSCFSLRDRIEGVLSTEVDHICRIAFGFGLGQIKSEALGIEIQRN